MMVSKPLKRTLKMCDKDVEVSSPQAMALAVEQEGNDSVLFKGQATEGLTTLHRVYR